MLRAMRASLLQAANLVLLAALLWGTSALAAGGKVTEYSAEMVNLDAKGKIEETQKIFFSSGKIRVEMNSPMKQDQKMIMIMRPDTRKHWMINPADKTYFENVFDEKQVEKTLGIKPGDIQSSEKEEDLGSETVSGYSCRKKRVTTTTKFMGNTTKSVSTIWIAQEFDFPLRELEEDGSLQEVRNIKVGQQADSLFTVPAGYRKITNMMEFATSMADQDEENDEQEEAPAPGPGANGSMPQGMKLPEGITLPPGIKIPGM